MFIKNVFSVLFLLPLLISCRPKPIDIEVPQKPGKLSISSVAFGDRSIFVSAGYSIEAAFDLADTSQERRKTLLPELTVDSGLVTITELGHLPDTLKMYNPGLYGRNNLQLKPYAQYVLTVIDHRKGTAISATTTYLPRPQIEELQPEITRTEKDATVKLHIKLSDIKSGEHFFIGYSTNPNVISAMTPLLTGLGALQSFEAKQIELINGDKAVNGQIEHRFTLPVQATDTLVVQVGRIDEKYFKYLDAYKRTGFLLNQVSGEPINLPTNINPGLGYFSLYVPQRTRFYLNEF